MRNGKFTARRTSGAKVFTLILALALTVGCVVGGTVAWLTAQSGTVTNAFTVGDINISLAETTGTSYKVVPGATQAKDPTVTVASGSEKCYVYVKVTNNLVIGNDTVATVNIDSTNWVVVSNSGNTTLYRYKEVVDALSAAQTLPVFTQVSYDGDKILKTNIETLDGKTIVVQAYAHQSDNTTQANADTAAKDWAGIK